jgi:hypothetical protein
MSSYDSDLIERAVGLYLEMTRPLERHLTIILGKVDNVRMTPQPNCHDSLYYEDMGIVVVREADRVLGVFTVGPDADLTFVDIDGGGLERLTTAINQAQIFREQNRKVQEQN